MLVPMIGRGISGISFCRQQMPLSKLMTSLQFGRVGDETFGQFMSSVYQQFQPNNVGRVSSFLTLVS